MDNKENHGMRIFGYVRVSTVEQNTDRQYTALLDYGVKQENIFEDKWTGADFDRPAYKKLLQTLEPRDLLVVKSLDRLGRSYKDMLKQWQLLTDEMGVDIYIIDTPVLDTRKCNGLTADLISGILLQLMSYVSQIERESLLQRQKEGIIEAKKRGVSFGRPPKKVPAEFPKLKQKYLLGKISSREASKMLGISHSTFLRWIKKY